MPTASPARTPGSTAESDSASTNAACCESVAPRWPAGGALPHVAPEGAGGQAGEGEQQHRRCSADEQDAPRRRAARRRASESASSGAVSRTGRWPPSAAPAPDPPWRAGDRRPRCARCPNRVLPSSRSCGRTGEAAAAIARPRTLPESSTGSGRIVVTVDCVARPPAPKGTSEVSVPVPTTARRTPKSSTRAQRRATDLDDLAARRRAGPGSRPVRRWT